MNQPNLISHRKPLSFVDRFNWREGSNRNMCVRCHKINNKRITREIIDFWIISYGLTSKIEDPIYTLLLYFIEVKKERLKIKRTEMTAVHVLRVKPYWKQLCACQWQWGTTLVFITLLSVGKKKIYSLMAESEDESWYRTFIKYLFLNFFIIYPNHESNFKS